MPRSSAAAPTTTAAVRPPRQQRRVYFKTTSPVSSSYKWLFRRSVARALSRFSRLIFSRLRRRSHTHTPISRAVFSDSTVPAARSTTSEWFSRLKVFYSFLTFLLPVDRVQDAGVPHENHREHTGTRRPAGEWNPLIVLTRIAGFIVIIKFEKKHKVFKPEAAHFGATLRDGRKKNFIFDRRRITYQRYFSWWAKKIRTTTICCSFQCQPCSPVARTPHSAQSFNSSLTQLK